jgi:hypothetical protein
MRVGGREVRLYKSQHPEKMAELLSSQKSLRGLKHKGFIYIWRERKAGEAGQWTERITC